MIKCFVIDDEPLAIKLLTNYIKLTDGLELVEAFSDPIKALHALNEHEVDLLFLDIQMPELSGIQFLKIIKDKYAVILTTAYENYALEGFEYGVVDYLLKPIGLDRFIIATNKAKKLLSSGNGKMELPTKTPSISIPSNPGYIFVKSEYKTQKIYLSDILYLEGLGDYVSIQSTNGQILTLENMKSFVESLPDHQFIRVHKSYIVAIDKIDFIQRNRIVINEQYIPIGATYQKRFWEKIKR